MKIVKQWKGFMEYARKNHLSKSERTLYMEVLDKWDSLGHPDHVDMCDNDMRERSGMMEKTIRKARQALNDMGVLKSTSGKTGRVTEYRLTMMF